MAIQELLIERIRINPKKEFLNSIVDFIEDRLSSSKRNVVSDAYESYANHALHTDQLIDIISSKIGSITDQALLNELIVFIDENDSVIYSTGKEQKVRIKESEEQIAKGQFFTNEQVEEEVKEWLKEN